MIKIANNLIPFLTVKYADESFALAMLSRLSKLVGVGAKKEKQDRMRAPSGAATLTPIPLRSPESFAAQSTTAGRLAVTSPEAELPSSTIYSTAKTTKNMDKPDLSLTAGDTTPNITRTT